MGKRFGGRFFYSMFAQADAEPGIFPKTNSTEDKKLVQYNLLWVNLLQNERRHEIERKIFWARMSCEIARKRSSAPLRTISQGRRRPGYFWPMGVDVHFARGSGELRGVLSKNDRPECRSEKVRADMFRGFLFFLFLLSGVLQPASLPAGTPGEDKKVIGQECWVHVEGLALDYLAQVDTGATTTSLHATDYLIAGESDDQRENVGKTINFLTISTSGEYKRMTAEIARVQTVVNAQGREKRYMVWLTLSAKGVRKPVLVNLRDRSKLKHKLLVGRDWLVGDFLVDVALDREEASEESEEK